MNKKEETIKVELASEDENRLAQLFEILIRADKESKGISR